VYKPHVLIINASPRKYGSSTQLAKVAEIGALDAGGEVESIFLYDYNIKPCIGCVSDNVNYCRFPCIIGDDDFNKIGEVIVRADGLIIATPVYWYGPSGVLKNFIDRLTSMENMIFHGGRSLLEGKVAGFIATGADSGVMMTISYLAIVLNSMGVVIAPWSMAYTHEEDALSDEAALKDAYNVGYLVVETIKALKNYGKYIGYTPIVDTQRLRDIVGDYVRKLNNREERAKFIERLASRSISTDN
jgi:multimeric flavodoxin WrbA